MLSTLMYQNIRRSNKPLSIKENCEWLYILMSIQSLLDKNPLHHEPGQEKNLSPEEIEPIIKYHGKN